MTKRIFIFIYFFAFNSFAAIVELDDVSDLALSKMLSKVDVEISVDQSLVSPRHQGPRLIGSESIQRPSREILFSISKFIPWLGWQDHQSCELELVGSTYMCSFKDVDMSNVASGNSSVNYYEINIMYPYARPRDRFCNNIKFRKNDLVVNKSGFRDLPSYTLSIDMDGCSFYK